MTDASRRAGWGSDQGLTPWQGWAPLVVLPPAVLVIGLPRWPPWVVMWTLAVAIYGGSKWLTWRRTPVRGAPAWKHIAYLLAWPGLDAAAFLGGAPADTVRPTPREWLTAAARLALGVAVFYGAARSIDIRHAYAVGWIGMIGLVLILHFGAFAVLSCVWRRLGIQARPLMNRPLASTSLSEFWGSWNTAFRDLTYRFLFRPFRRWFGARWGIVAGFLFSGAVHDLVVSVPARGGYGGPTIFFAVQGAAMIVERSRFGRRMGLGSGVPGRLFAMLALVAPVGLLFHRPFVERIVVPFMRAVGAV